MSKLPQVGRNIGLSENNDGKNKTSLQRIVYAYTAYVQAPIIFLTNVALCMIGAYLLVEKCGAPDYVMIIGIVLGVLSGFYGMFKYLHMILKDDGKKGKNDSERKS